MAEKDYRALMQSALLELRELRAKLKAYEDKQTVGQIAEPTASESIANEPIAEAIAVIGIGCRFPGGANSPTAFWQLLREGVDAITELPSDRWHLADYYDADAVDPEAAGKIASRYGGFVDQLQDFDADFFGIAEREALSLDPQQRLLLEVSWEALEYAGIVPELGSPTGVFIGISSNDYSQQLLTRSPDQIDAYLATGNSHSTAAGRLSYTFGFTGPSLAVDTACSSSLVAVHLACQSLRSQECSLAIVGGVNRIISPEFSVNFTKAKMLSPDGRCKTFAAGADGFGRAEGCGVVVLKRLSAAVADGNQILAVIRGSAVNQDGRSGGLTVPNGPAQQQVIQQALQNSQLQPDQISYIEAHGTGTALGDPIEVNALGAVFGQSHTHQHPLVIGSVKTNLGHLEAAAGIAGLIKVVLSLHHREVPAHLHFQQPSPHIPWSDLPIQVPTHHQPWHQLWSSDRLRAGVSSFGFSGTNAHVILEEAGELEHRVERSAEDCPLSLPLSLLTLSAKSPEALQALAVNYHQFLSEQPDLRFPDVCFSANTGRAQFSHRLTLIAASSSEAAEKLAAFQRGQLVEGLSIDGSTAVHLGCMEPEELALSAGQASAGQASASSGLPVSDADSDAEWQTRLTSLAQIYREGAAIDWQGFYPPHSRQWVNLPTYPFQRQRYWVEGSSIRQMQVDRHPLLGVRLQLSRSQAIYYENQLAPKRPEFLSDHRVLGTVMLPLAAYVEMALAAAAQLELGQRVENLSVQKPVELSERYKNSKTVQFVLNAENKFEILSQNGAVWELHATGNVSAAETRTQSMSQNINLAELKVKCNRELNLTSYYQQFRKRGIDYGAAFQVLTAIWQGESQALGQIQLPDSLDRAYSLHPLLLDGAFQVIGAALDLESTAIYLPVGLDALTLHSASNRSLWCYVQLDSQRLTADLTLFNSDGRLVATVSALKIQKTTRAAANIPPDWLYQMTWQPQPLLAEPDYSPAALSQQVKLDEALAQPEMIAYQALLPQLEYLSFAYLLQALSALGWKPALDQHYRTSELAQQLAVVESQQQLLGRLLEILAEEGILQPQADGWRVVQLPPVLDPAPLLKQLRAQYPLASAELSLLHRCAAPLANLLRGAVDPVQLLFPGDDLTATSQLYQDSPGAKLMNGLVQDLLSAALANHPSDRPIRLLEVGAGTGGTTASLLPVLAEVEADYTFTDVSPLFIQNAKQKFADCTFIQYQTLDIEQLPNVPVQYDIVIAANVIHATQDLAQSFSHIHELLSPGGLLILLEGVRPTRWLDLIFGLTPGWWRFRDSNLRPNYPLLSDSEWRRVLQSSGFESVEAINPDPQSAPQAVFVARRPLLAAVIYMLFSDRQGVGQQLAQQLRQELRSQGQVVQVFAGESYQQQSDREFTIDPTSSADLQRLLELFQGSVHIIHLWSLDISTADQDSPSSDFLADIQPVFTSILNLVQTNRKMTLWLVTQRAVSAEREAVLGIAQAPVWGLGKVIALEHPELRCRRIDLDAASSPETQAQLLIAELRQPSAEDEIAFRQHHVSTRYVPRLSRDQTLSQAYQPFQLSSTARGTLDSLTLEPQSRRLPNPDEVEIQVRAAGLNFIDVLDALGLLPFERQGFGVECAGEIVAVGAAVQNFQVGEAVVALAADSFRQFVTINAAMVVHRPPHLSFESAASIPANFLTADYALNQIAKLKAGERVLIHAAAGGTGMAAVQLAQQVGAEVYATASPTKWEALRAVGLRHLFSSRQLDFAEQIRQVTDGEGVDVVLNSLSGEFIPASLSILNANGRFLEIGKRDIWTAEQVQKQYPHVTYRQIDLMQLAEQRPHQVQTLLRTLFQNFEAGLLQPLPQTVFPIQQASAAFRRMQQAKHIGKIVVGFPPLSKTEPLQIHADATYLITGGLGGLGLQVADWLRAQGATQVVLASRRPAQAQQMELLKQNGLQVMATQVDVSDWHQISELLAKIERDLPPLRGVFHAAGVLDDGLLQQLNWQRCKTVMAAKVAGAWHLHQLTQHQPLDYFVLFSSAASLLGSPGQANHVAANLFLDSLAHHRQAIGLPGLSINWGAWSAVGAAASRVEQMQARGLGSIAPEQGLNALAQLLQQPAAQVGVIPIDWDKLIQQSPSAPFLEAFRTSLPQPAQLTPLHLTLQQLNDSDQQLAQLVAYLQTEVSKVLGSTRLPKPQQGFFDLGMDSLMAVELKNRLETSLSISLPTTVIFAHPTIYDLAQHILQDHLQLIASETISPTPEALTAEQVEASILRELIELETVLKQQLK